MKRGRHLAGSLNWQDAIPTERRGRTRMARGKERARRASAGQAKAMEQVLSGMQPDTEGTAALDVCADDSLFAAGDLPDEEKEAARKVDFSVLRRKPETFTVFSDESVRNMDHETLTAYAISLGGAFRANLQEYILVAEQLCNAQELILNGRNALFGRSTQRLAAVSGKRAESRPQNQAKEDPVPKEEKERRDSTHRPRTATPLQRHRLYRPRHRCRPHRNRC